MNIPIDKQTQKFHVNDGAPEYCRTPKFTSEPHRVYQRIGQKPNRQTFYFQSSGYSLSTQIKYD